MFSSAFIEVGQKERGIVLFQETEWPWNGRVKFELKNPSERAIEIMVRIPGWATDWQVDSK